MTLLPEIKIVPSNSLIPFYLLDNWDTEIHKFFSILLEPIYIVNYYLSSQ